MKKKKEFFEKLALDWDNEHNTEEQNEKTRQFVDNHFRLNKGETVLDIGCGTGRLIPHLMRFIKETGNLAELDFSIDMLKIGRNRYE
jgi:ubiquinone/menaquinone biosynthesis C-methylase UbiE